MAGCMTKTSKRFIFVSANAVKKERRKREQFRLRDARRKHRYPNRSHHGPNYNERRRKEAQAKSLSKRLDSDFIFWDGESPQDTGYSLFGNSAGYMICHPFLSTLECLDLIMETEENHPAAIHISFGFNLDVSYILKDLPKRVLAALHHWGRAIWNGWEFEHIPHKWFKVKHGEVEAKIYDIHTFLPGGYVSSLQKFKVGTAEELNKLAQEKARRSLFMWADIDDIAEYWKLELKLGPYLGDAIRQSLYEAGNYVPRSWHGPGAIARMALQRHHIYDAMAICPPEVATAARYAFAGGRFESFIAGIVENFVYEWDINSAYPYYATHLPNLARGQWRSGQKYEPGKFAVYHIRYEAKRDKFRPYPLFRRFKDYSVAWGHRVEGWYWSPEAELVKDDPAATFIEAWIFDEEDETDRPFAFLGEYFARRKRLDHAGSIAAYAYKIIINAIYGQLAQRAGWDRKRRRPPKSHQLEWAGYITSACRAAVYKASIQAGDKLVSINTDSIQALCPLDNLDCGDNLGQWKEAKYAGGIFWQSGIYYLREDLGYPKELGYGWTKAKTRGIPKGTYTPEQLMEAIHLKTTLKLSKHMFISYTLADNGRWSELNTWKDEPHEFVMGGSGKRSHPRGLDNKLRGCDKLGCTATVHRLSNSMWSFQIADNEGEGIWSQPHYLPWLEPKARQRPDFDAIMAWDVMEMDPDEEWIGDYEAV